MATDDLEKSKSASTKASVYHAVEAKEKLSRSGKRAGAAVKDAATVQADRYIDQTSSGLHTSGRSLRNAADDLDERDAWLSTLLTRAADGLEKAGDYMSEKDLGAVVQDTQRLARENPAAFIGGGVALGFLLARVGKTTVQKGMEHSDAASTNGAQAGDATGAAGAESRPSSSSPGRTPGSRGNASNTTNHSANRSEA